MKGLIFRSEASLAHDTGGHRDHPEAVNGDHPESADRIVAIEAELDRLDWLGYEPRASAPATDAMLLRAHPQSHLDRVRAACAKSEPLDSDTVVVPASLAAALHAAGGAAALAEALCDGTAGFGASLHRPPGHHAEAERAMGFCLFNNVAVAALHALEVCGLERVLILDWDVHHGNGTEAIFASDPRVCFISLHQHPFYPGTGSASDQGEREGSGYTVNCPLPAGSGDGLFVGLTEQLVAPLVALYRPQLILISAGFDAHRDDPLAQCNVTDGGFAAMARAVYVAAGNASTPLGLVLEGGYNVDALARSLALSLSELAGMPTGKGSSEPIDPRAVGVAAPILARRAFAT